MSHDTQHIVNSVEMGRNDVAPIEAYTLNNALKPSTIYTWLSVGTDLTHSTFVMISYEYAVLCSIFMDLCLISSHLDV